jgi:hypothetical protein
VGDSPRTTAWRALLDDPRFRLSCGTAAAALYAGALALFSSASFSWPHPGLIAAAAALATAVTVLITGHVRRRRYLDRFRIRRETDHWMRAGVLPDDAPLGEALPRIAARISRNRKDLWRNSYYLALLTAEALLQLGHRHGAAEGVAFFSLLVLSAAVILGWTIYYRVRWVPVLQKLLTDGQRRLAAAPAAAR